MADGLKTDWCTSISSQARKVNGDDDRFWIRGFIQLWAIADFFLLKSMQQDCLEEFQTYLENEMLATTDLKAQPNFTEDALFEELEQGIAAAYHKYPHAEPCQRLLVHYAFTSRIQSLRQEAFLEIIENERDFAHAFFVKFVRTPDVQDLRRFPQPVLEGLNAREIYPEVLSFYEICRKPLAATYKVFHHYDKNRPLFRNYFIKAQPIISWSCGDCQAKQKRIWYES